MKVPLLDLHTQYCSLKAELDSSILAVLASTKYIMGSEVEGFEDEISNYLGVKHAIGVSSGTDALLVALMVFEIGPGDIVITTPYSFIATAGVIARLGAQPVFVDVDPESYNISPEALREWFAQNQSLIPRVKAIIPVHLYGQSADMGPIMALAGEQGIPIIEDAAQAIGAKYPAEAGLAKCGTMGAIGCFSFFPSKNLGGIGDGGLVVSNSSSVADKVRKLRNHGAEPKYYHALLGGNFRLDAIQAAALRVKLSRLEGWNRQRQHNAAYYDEKLQQLGIKTPTVIYSREHHVYNQYVICVSDRRDELRAFLSENNIGNEVYYPVPFHLQACFKKLGYRAGAFPVSEYLAKHSLAIPVYPELTVAMQDYVVAKIGEFYLGG